METSGRILFVDDDPRVLEGLRNLLRRHARTWDLSFAVGGGAALEMLDRQMFDVVVSDMTMPYVDGVAVLKYTHATHPETVRIGLSSESGEDLALRAATVAHQSLTKPLTPDELERTLHRALKLRALIADPIMRAAIGGLSELPALPQTYSRLMAVLDDPRSGMLDVARIVEGDVAATAQILHLVNSAFFGFGHPVKTILQAVQLLGVDLVKGLVLSTSFVSGSMTPEMSRACEELQTHSVQVAHVASSIAKPAWRRDALTAGLLHDIGWLVQIHCGPRTVLKTMGRRFSTLAAEPEDGGLHAALGAYLLGLWGLSLDVIDAVAMHHHPVTEANTSPIAMVLRRAELGLRRALAEKTPFLRERAIALAADPNMG